MNGPMNHPTSKEEDGATASDRYTNCLLGSFIDDRNFGFDQLQSYIWENWGQHQHAWLVGMENNFFIIKFSSVEYLLAILHNGPYSVDGALFVLRRWEPGLELRNLRITEILVWIRLTGLPMELINPIAGPKLASMIGEVEEDRTGIFGPHNVRSLSYLSARVWINPADPLMPGFYVRLPGAKGSLIWVDCWYERIHNYCRRCGKIGHPKDCCPIQDNVELESYLDEHFQRISDERGSPMLRDPTKELYHSPGRDHRRMLGKRTTRIPASYFEESMRHFLPSNAGRFPDGFCSVVLQQDSASENDTNLQSEVDG